MMSAASGGPEGGNDAVVTAGAVRGPVGTSVGGFGCGVASVLATTAGAGAACITGGGISTLALGAGISSVLSDGNDPGNGASGDLRATITTGLRDCATCIRTCGPCAIRCGVECGET